MRKSYPLLLLVLLPLIAYSQNLIPNPSFEDENVCHAYQEKCCPSAWRSATLKNFRYSEYVETQHKLHRRPAEGKYTADLLMYNSVRSFARKFMQVPLLCPLKAGKTYRLSFQINTENFMVDAFGIYFSDSLFVFKKEKELEGLDAQINIRMEKILEQRKWHKIEYDYVAKGKECGIIIGNFKSDADTKITPLFKKKKWIKRYDEISSIYYRFDDFKLEALEAGHDDCDLVAQKARIYKDAVRHNASHKIYMPSQTSVLPLPLHLDSMDIKDTLPISPPPLIASAIIAGQSFVLEAIQFKTNSAELLPSAYAALDELVNYLQQHSSNQLRIIGHTDAVGTERNNQVLSLQRARSVATFLRQKDIHYSRLKCLGKGEREPIADNATDTGRKQNRRVVFEWLE